MKKMILETPFLPQKSGFLSGCIEIVFWYPMKVSVEFRTTKFRGIPLYTEFREIRISPE